MDYSPPGSSVHGILQTRVLQWVAMPSSRGSSWPRNRTLISLRLLHWQAGSSLTAPPGSPYLVESQEAWWESVAPGEVSAWAAPLETGSWSSSPSHGPGSPWRTLFSRVLGLLTPPRCYRGPNLCVATDFIQASPRGHGLRSAILKQSLEPLLANSSDWVLDKQ